MLFETGLEASAILTAVKSKFFRVSPTYELLPSPS